MSSFTDFVIFSTATDGAQSCIISICMSGMLKEMDVGKTKTIIANNSRDVSLISALTSNLEQLEYLLLKYNDIIDIIIKRKYQIAKKRQHIFVYRFCNFLDSHRWRSKLYISISHTLLG